MSERYINKKCQNCGSLRGVDHEYECDCCGGDIWVFVCSKHPLFSLTTTSCPLCTAEVSYLSQEQKWTSTHQRYECKKYPYKTFLIFGIIIGSVFMYYFKNLEFYESKQAKVNRQSIETLDSQLEAVNTKIEESKKLLNTSNDNIYELQQENNKKTINLNKYQQSAATEKDLINDEILNLKRDIQEYTQENTKLLKLLTASRNSIKTKLKNTPKQQNIDTNKYYKYDELDKKLNIVFKSSPINPKRSLFTPSSGSTRVKLLIDVNGRIVSTEVIKSTHRKFTKATLEALKEWVFTPGEKNGIKVKVAMELNFRFSLGATTWDPF